MIEVLSPANKNGAGREQYLQKQADLLATQVNLVEINLLSSWTTPTLARNAFELTPPESRYVVSVSRLYRRQNFGVLFAKNHLPRCRIPLAADPDAILNLPAVFDRCYEVGGYDLLVNYAKAPPVALSESESAWLRNLLTEQSAI